MSINVSYRKAFYLALGLHLSIALLLFMESHSEQAVLSLDAKPQLVQTPETETSHQEELVKAVSVDSSEVRDTMRRLKDEKLKQQQQELARQNKLEQQAQEARQSRVKEQQRLKKLQEEADKIALARKKEMDDEKRRLKRLAAEKAREEKQLAAVKKQHEALKAQQQMLEKQKEEARRLAVLQKQKAQEEANARRLAAEREEAANKAAKQAQIAGEVNKYKALIVNAISRQWILPDNVNGSLYSQFRIRLAPDGMVLDVNLIRSSGDSVLDRSAQTAIYKASPLPVPSDPDAFNLFRDISLTVRPEQVRG